MSEELVNVIRLKTPEEKEFHYTADPEETEDVIKKIRENYSRDAQLKHFGAIILILFVGLYILFELSSPGSPYPLVQISLTMILIIVAYRIVSSKFLPSTNPNEIPGFSIDVVEERISKELAKERYNIVE